MINDIATRSLGLSVSQKPHHRKAVTNDVGMATKTINEFQNFVEIKASITTPTEPAKIKSKQREVTPAIVL
ncbi:MAG: hypothetical protein IPN97_11605 [Saprospiraceae bacterium]|nr:hypothetical protein [Saprospiraceae bacterium]